MEEMKNKINWSLWLSVVAIILSIFSFFISEGTLQFDSVNFIIGVLAILVTALIGWQIFNVIQFENRFEKIRKQLKMDIHKESNNIRFEIINILKTNNNVYSAINTLITAIKNSTEENNEDDIRKNIDNLYDNGFFTFLYISEKDKDTLLKRINEELSTEKQRNSNVQKLKKYLEGISYFQQ